MWKRHKQIINSSSQPICMYTDVTQLGTGLLSEWEPVRARCEMSKLISFTCIVRIKNKATKYGIVLRVPFVSSFTLSCRIRLWRYFYIEGFLVFFNKSEVGCTKERRTRILLCISPAFYDRTLRDRRGATSTQSGGHSTFRNRFL